MNTNDGHLWYKMVNKLPGIAVIYLMGVTTIHLDDGQDDCKISIIINKKGLLQKVESSAKYVTTSSIYYEGPIYIAIISFVNQLTFLVFYFCSTNLMMNIIEGRCFVGTLTLSWVGRMLTAVSSKV